ncbi:MULTISPECIES: DUF5682 family protein [Calothrix]|uniref:Uncharacterized protein n=2 Tax=Calothrix TaxID=1186 RepID=A0ABR8A5H2_9CYAN|nr:MULTISPECIES: DUF5682 family protein [Calothrix]MBD2195222.1 hypothetical protein [Calothrix parietina FACHB-288]MBD2223807.1 hypothetical protein [Calothrix anomala FACHB-343]
MVTLPTAFNALQEQLLNAAEKFATDAQPLSEMLTALIQDVEKASSEPLEIFPVCHHSPSSALQMVRRLREKPPKVIYLELCEDLQNTVENLRHCKLPVALQAFAAESEHFSPKIMPLSVVAPITEASAEYQAIAFALQNPQTQLVFVDRAVDFVFQWEPPDTKLAEESEEPASDEAKMHGSAVGVEVGSLVPTFDQFLSFLLRNSNTRHFSEWWDEYVETAIIGADYETYRQVMFLIGSLMRRLGTRNKDIEIDRQRERYMWTSMKKHMATHNIAPSEAIYICGAAHSASDVEEYSVTNNNIWEIPERTQTKWLYGLIPSSFAAIEYQFHHPAGTVSLAEATWKKNLKVTGLKGFSLNKEEKATKTKPSPVTATNSNLTAFLTRPPELAVADTEQLLQWCADIVGLARKNAYLASTADSIAIYQTSMLLAGMRNRMHPTPYDFQDAAITCLEKDRTPKKRNIYQLCQILLGGDRIGTVGYASLPPLAQDVYDRLQPLGVNLLAQTNQRALMDFKQQPELLPCSDVLWRLHYLLSDTIVKPIIGDRSLGSKPIQESWEIRIGKYQRHLIMLGYEGVSIEQVLEQRLKQTAFSPQAKTSDVLKATEDSILYARSLRLTQELGEHAISLLKQETGVSDAPQVFERVRRLVHYYRATPTALPQWIESFVTTGYGHYATLLPQAFADRGTTPEQIAGMLNFIFTLESLALSLGCNRSQLLIGVKQSSQGLDDPAKIGLLWTTEWLLTLRKLEEIREFFNDVINNEMLIKSFPEYLNGFILSLTFAPRISKFVVELLSKLFATVPDKILLPWLPSLILKLRPHAQILQGLIKEASSNFPKNLAGFNNWIPAWSKPQPEMQKQVQLVEAAPTLSKSELRIREFLFNSPATTNALAKLLGIENLSWEENLETPQTPSHNLSESESKIQQLISTHPATLNYFATLL